MHLTFAGAARAVTGSAHLLEIGKKRILVDCGLQQGGDEVDNAYLPFFAGGIDAVILTHAHIDHSGRLPLLVKQGFRGPIYATEMTVRLADIMLRDSAHIQESDAEWQNRKGKRAGKGAVEPLYTQADAEAAIAQMAPCTYNEMVEILPTVRLRFTDAGHILGSAFAEVWAIEGAEERKIVFSGDIGNYGHPVIRDPGRIEEADFVVMESTYGDRNHEKVDDDQEELAQIIEQTFRAGGNVVIPAFAVGRTQELLYSMREMKQRGLVKQFPDFPVYVDSPLAREATMIFSGDLTGYLDEEAMALVANGKQMFNFDGLRLCESVEESKALNEDKSSKVIISASGMCDAGRIRHHLKHNLWRPECTVVFVGFQTRGGLGRLLLDGAEKVKLFGEEIAVRAKMVNLKGMSGHADRDGLLDWIGAFQSKLRHVFVVHGEREIAPLFAETLNELDYKAHAPEYQEVYNLLENKIETQGVPPVRKKAQQDESPAYLRLVAVGQQLMDAIRRNKGGTNKDLGRFADAVRALIQKFDR